MTQSDTELDLERLSQIWVQLGDALRGNSPPPNERFSTLGQALTSSMWPTEVEPTLHLAKEIYGFRQTRGEFFDPSLFSDPSWDILLELYRLRLEGRRASVKSVCIASGVPPTTALRWINILLAKGLLNRTEDQNDQRVRWIALSDKGYNSMRALLETLLKSQEGAGQVFGEMPILKIEGFKR